MGISRQEALDCFRSDDLIGIGMEADSVRRRLHPEGVVSYAIDCMIDCAALTSGVRAGSKTEEDAARSSLYSKIAESVEMGSTAVRLVNGPGGPGSGSKARGIEGFEAVLRGLRQHFPSLWIEGLSAGEIGSLAMGCGLGLREAIARLRDAGMDSIARDNAASFDRAVGDRIAQPGCSVAQWIEVHRAAHGLGMRTVASMPFGFGERETGADATGAGKVSASVAGAAMDGALETMRQQVDLLQEVRRLQEETGGFTAFLPWDFESRNAAAGGWDGPTAVEQMKTLAIARIFLDCIENIQLCTAAQGLKVLQMGLRFGANDAGSLTPQAYGTQSGIGTDAGGSQNAAAANRAGEEDLRRIIRDAGFQPVQRDAPYRTLFLN